MKKNYIITNNNYLDNKYCMTNKTNLLLLALLLLGNKPKSYFDVN